MVDKRDSQPISSYPTRVALPMKIVLRKLSWHSSRNKRKYQSMEIFRSLLQYLKENFLHNPIMWGIAAVALWIIGAAFIKAWRGKDEDEE
jgi:hypothetical protein